MDSFFLRGLLIGFSIAAPVGPIGALCIRRTLAYGRLTGILSGLGAATADAVYGSIAALGLTMISAFLIDRQNWLRLAGGVFLVYLGARIFLSRQQAQAEAANTSRSVKRPFALLRAYASTFFLTLTNPLTILSFSAIFAGLGITTAGGGSNSALLLILGVFSGSALWWLLLSVLADAVRARFLRPDGLLWVNRISGLVIAGFGLAAVLSAGPPLLAANGQSGVQSSLVEAAAPEDLSGYRRADRPRTLTFPGDHGPHPEFQTEWWYYTGNLEAAGGRHFGYQLTFFRRALLPAEPGAERPSAWASRQAYMAHFALTDVGGKRYWALERLSRGAAGLAGAQAAPFEVWLEAWDVTEVEPGVYRLRASAPAEETDSDQIPLSLDLILRDTKGPVLQGDRGYSRKGSEPGQASYYYSLTRLQSSGEVQIGGERFPVEGLSWMDHEFSTSALAQDQVGWDWFALQLDGGRELMVFQIRKIDGSIDPFSSGTLIELDGTARHLNREDFAIEVRSTWTSPHSGAVYPSGWEISIPSAALTLQIEPHLVDQELNVSYSYWEGAVRIGGQHQGRAVRGDGYVELTGYSGSMGGQF